VQGLNFKKLTDWGISDSSIIPWSGSITGLFAKEYFSEIASLDEGWHQVCTTAELNIVISGGEDDDLCSSSTDVRYLAGCREGYYQPLRNPSLPAKACPEGFFCPAKVACMIQCISGTQCYNSTWSASSKECIFPGIMGESNEMLPIDSGSIAMPVEKKSTRRRQSTGSSRIGHRAPTRALALKQNDTSSEADLQEQTATQDTTILCPGSLALNLCGAGYYCPSPVTSFPCPAGFFCPVGSAFPRICPFLASCTETTSAYPSYWAHSMLLMASMVVVHVVWSTFLKRRREDHRKRRKAEREYRGNEKEMHEMANISKVGYDVQNPWSMEDGIFETKAWGGVGKTSVTEPPPFTPLSSFFDKHRRTQMDLKFDDLSVRSRSGESCVLLNQVSGRCRPGRSTLILVRHARKNVQIVVGTHCTVSVSHHLLSIFFSQGPSGSGKTTLLNCLAGHSAHLEQFGTIYVNGIKNSMSYFSNLVGFVRQVSRHRLYQCMC